MSSELPPVPGNHKEGATEFLEFSSEVQSKESAFKGPASRYRDLDIEKIVDEGQSRNEQMTPQFRSIQTIDIFDKSNRHATEEEQKGAPAQLHRPKTAIVVTEAALAAELEYPPEDRSSPPQ